MELQIRHLNRKNDLKNDHQDREIRMLKTLMTKIINKESNINEVITTAAREDNELMMQKRPSRLLPQHFFKYI